MIEQIRLAAGVLLIVAGVIGIACNVPPPKWLGITCGVYILAHWTERRYLAKRP